MIDTRILALRGRAVPVRGKHRFVFSGKGNGGLPPAFFSLTTSENKDNESPDLKAGKTRLRLPAVLGDRGE